MATRNQPQLTELAMLAECTGKAGASLLADVLDRINRWPERQRLARAH